MSDEQPSPNPDQAQDYKYWAFISYSHADDTWARWLFKALETYDVPKKLVGTLSRDGVPIPARAEPIFRDRDELPGSAKLTDNIEDALRRSRYLVVICSPNSVASQWVDQEIRIFKSLGREDRVLCFITEGEPNCTHRPELGLKECFPEAVRFWVDADRRITEIPTEPIAADARKGKDGKNNAVLKLLAGILGVQYNDLRQRAQERKAKRDRLLKIAIGIVMVGLAVTCWQFALLKNEAVRNQHFAEEQRNAADVARKKAVEEEKKALAANAAERKAKEEAVASANQERLAKEEEAKQRQLADEQRVKAVEAGKIAVAAKEEAQNSEQNMRRTFAAADLGSATRLIEENNQSKALAYLARSLGFDPNNPAVVGRVITLLSQRSWAIPSEPMTHEGEVTYVEYSHDGKKLLTLAGNTVKLWDVAGNQLLHSFQHEKTIHSTALSPDGKYVATAAEDNTAQLWDAATGKKIGAPLSHDGWAICAAFSPDGKYLATASGNHTIYAWDVATGKQSIHPISAPASIHSISFHSTKNWLLVVVQKNAQVWNIDNGLSVSLPVYHEGGNIAAAAFSPSGKYFATASGDKTARIWETATGQPASDVLKHDNWVVAVAFSPDERWLVTGSTDNTAKVWEVPRGKIVATFHHDGEIKDVAFSPNGLWVATASLDDTAVVWDVAHEKAAVEPLKHNGPVFKLAFSPDGRFLATGSADRTAKNWNIVSGKPAFAPFRHSQPVNTAVFSPDGKMVATASSDRTARVWDLGSGRPITKPLQHKLGVISLLFTPDGKNLITGSEDGNVRVWDIHTELVSTTISTSHMMHSGWVNDLALSPDGETLATASDDRTAGLWNLATGKLIYSLSHYNPVKSVAFTADGKWLVTHAAQKTTHLWNVATGKPGLDLIRPNSNAEIRSADVSKDGKWAAAGLSDHTAVIWDPSTGRQSNSLIHDADVSIVTFSPPNDRFPHQLILTVAGKLARVWDAETGTAITEPIKHDEAITNACFSPDGNFFVTTFGSHARVWESTSGRAVSDLLTHRDTIRAANFSADGHLLVTASADKSARVWFVAVQGKAPKWLGELVNGLGGYSLDDSGATQMIPDPAKNIASVRAALTEADAGQYSQWGRWFLDDRATRATFAFGSTPVAQYVGQRIAAGDEASLEEALQIEPNNGLGLAKLGLISKTPSQAEHLTKLAEHFDPSNPDVLWIRASILQEQNQPDESLAVMERALKLDPRNVASFGPEGANIIDDDTDGILAQGWLPKGWMDRSDSAPIEITYATVNNGPPGGLLALEMKVVSPVPASATLTGPHLVCKKGTRVTIEGWARSNAAKSDLNISLSQLVEPHKNYYEQVIHANPDWKPFKLQFSPQQDIAAEILIREPNGTVIQFAGITIKQE